MSLYRVLADDRDELADDLLAAEPAEAGARLHEYCRRLARRYSDLPETNEEQDRAGTLTLEVAGASLEALGAVTGAVDVEATPTQRTPGWVAIAGAGVALVCALALSVGAPAVVGVAGLVIAAAACLLLRARRPAPVRPVAATFDAPAALDRLADALRTGDQLLDVVRRLDARPAPVPELGPGLLRVLQALLGAGLADNCGKAMANIEVLFDALADEGIDVVQYDGPNAVLFEPRAVLDDPAAPPVMSAPALLRGERILVRGTLLVPSIPDSSPT
jgi:hypothetical protein